MPSSAATAALERARDQQVDAMLRLDRAEVLVLAPVRATIQRNHIADKIKRVFAA